MKYIVNIISILLGCCISATAQTFNALKWNQNTAYHSYLMRDVHQQFLDRKIDLEKAITSKKAVQKYLSECIQRYESIIGEFPERGELNARVVGTVIYRIMERKYIQLHLNSADIHSMEKDRIRMPQYLWQ